MSYCHSGREEFLPGILHDDLSVSAHTFNDQTQCTPVHLRGKVGTRHVYVHVHIIFTCACACMLYMRIREPVDSLCRDGNHISLNICSGSELPNAAVTYKVF